MIDFTLSKINLLILAVALFSIFSFFAFNVGQIFLVNEVKQKLEKYVTVLNQSVAAPTTCDSIPNVIPSKFVSFGNNVYYKLSISQITENTSATTRLILGVYDNRHPENVLASASMASTAQIIIYDNTTGTFAPLNPNEELILDPQAVPPRNAFYAVKTVRQGQTKLYILPCAVTANSNTCGDLTQGNKFLVNQTLPLEERFPC
ncbi:MAG: hypothetical protein IPJ89_03525 [Candidatus Iainarchaeum archaeon]|uniref:Uncharacterized protein n=1 Tax=Candidatus Iainarchaeum sp. TaxID=3101447 RepID=A0A7T9DIY0_9ARCH|nr:MAG: hypothetical protein IPJ89_03525 [Candidatus Diapherotrites archaeon]